MVAGFKHDSARVRTILIIVHPEHVSPVALAFVDVVIATGESAGAKLSAFAKTTQTALSSDLPAVPETGEALVWFARKRNAPVLVKTRMAKSERRRHRKNYAQGGYHPSRASIFAAPMGS
jgi:hypothetical protein